MTTQVPWLLWLGALSASLRTKGSLVQFPVRAHGWVVGQVPGWGHERQPHMGISLPLLPPPSPLSARDTENPQGLLSQGPMAGSLLPSHP